MSRVVQCLPGLGLATERHKEGTFELLLKKYLAIHQTEEGIAGNQKGLRRGKTRKTRPVCVAWRMTGSSSGAHDAGGKRGGW